MPVMRRVLFIVLAAALAAVNAAAAAEPNPYTIFANARSYWLAQRYPQMLAYDVAVAVTEGGKQRVERYDSALDARTGRIVVDPVSDYELAHPVKPKGINLGLLFPIGKPLPPIDFLGVPHLAPTYSFGMAPFVPAPTPTPFDSAALVRDIRREFHDPNPRVSSPAPSPSGLQTIVVTAASARDYTIRLLGEEPVDGHLCYHLALHPTHDPQRLRIREAWIDEHTFAVWKLIDALNFKSGAGTTVPWTIRFADLDGAHYIAEEDANAPLRAGGEIYTRTTVRFELLRAVARMPLGPPIVAGVARGERLEEP